MPGSTVKQCVSCLKHIPVACKVCKLCGTRQPMKKKIPRAQGKASREWPTKLRKTSNESKLADTARILVHKLKMAGLHPLLLYGYGKKDKLSCGYLNGSEGVTTKELEIVSAINDLYQSLLEVIIQRKEKAHTGCLIDNEGQREPAGLSLDTRVKEEDVAFPVTLTPLVIIQRERKRPIQSAWWTITQTTPAGLSMNTKVKEEDLTCPLTLRDVTASATATLASEASPSPVVPLSPQVCLQPHLFFTEADSHMIRNNSEVEEDRMKCEN